MQTGRFHIRPPWAAYALAFTMRPPPLGFKPIPRTRSSAAEAPRTRMHRRARPTRMRGPVQTSARGTRGGAVLLAPRLGCRAWPCEPPPAARKGYGFGVS